MLTTPIFRPWRPLWDAQLADATRQLDELAKERQKGRQVPPPVHDWSDAQRVLLAAHLAKGRVSSVKFMQDKIEPLLKACVWPRWLLLEAALDHAATSGDLHLSALILRSQIEELDALRTVAIVLSCREQGSWNAEAMANAIQTMTKRVLPRLETKTDEQLIEQATDAATAATRSEPLQRVFDRLSEYVHPNYGSHVLTVRPHGVEAAKVFVEAFVSIYEAFLSLPWAKDGDDSREEPTQRGQTDSRDPYLILADDTIPTLKPAFPGVGEKKWDDAAECFRHRAACENNWAALEDLPTDIEAIRALSANSVPSDSWPEALRTVAGQNRYAFLVAQEHRLAQDAAHLVAGTGLCDDKERLSVLVLVSGLNFAINVTEHKLDLLARQAARLINAENVLGATLAVRSMLEHHAVAIELGDKLRALWERAEKGAPNAPQVAEAFAEAEKQIARVLAGSSQPSEVSSSWRSLWQETIRRPYNVLGPVKALDAAQPGFLKTYGLLSHIVHGTVCTGGDLLGTRSGGSKAGHPMLAQLILNLARLCDTDAILDRQAVSMTVAHRLDVLRRDPSGLGERIKAMNLLEGQKLKPGRDIFGSGTANDPYRFRDGLLYHDAYYHYLAQEGIQVRNRRLEQLSGGFGDRVEAEDGRVLYFLNDKLHLQ
ncbi:hypothetical protein [Desulfoglaeba alkanexedens]|uniref:Uncharacterized protein n=1 Tax=Desulfoglaeba alkanexedens ALDC TaxID=980445 RepID=A0A4P8L321_9BACT|nr:hypothetical protein [Desulfoglaeba alkanexedens]QCQ22144.1 hypothetical protein FDQ92_08205 [Desulfoglaeba alkanexedens ALDC]